jgi:hypothetical protein
MDDVVSERLGILLAKRLGAGSFHPASAARDAAPKDIVFASGIDADDGPHIMIVGENGHHRRPEDVEDGQIVRLVELVNPSAFGFT